MSIVLCLGSSQIFYNKYQRNVTAVKTSIFLRRVVFRTKHVSKLKIPNENEVIIRKIYETSNMHFIGLSFEKSMKTSYK